MRPIPRNPRYGSLDIWRGIACLMVVVFHATWYSSVQNSGAAHDFAWWLVAFTRRLWMGVPLFFVISGYCISATADATRLRGKSTANYFWRRFRRIFPPYWAALGGYVAVIAAAVLVWHFRPAAVFAGQVYMPSELNLRHWIGNVSLTEVWSYKLMGSDRRLFLGQAWSLCFEEIFYATVGTLLCLARRHVFQGLGVITLAAVAGLGAVWLHPVRAAVPPLVYWLGFASGVLVYYTLNYASTRRYALILLLSGSLIVLRHPAWILAEAANPTQFAFAAFPFALLLLLLRNADWQIMSWRWTMPLQYCGTLCYSLYLVHWPVVAALSIALFRVGVRSMAATLLVTTPVCLAVSLGVAELFHRLVERHFLNAPLAGAVSHTDIREREGALFARIGGQPDEACGCENAGRVPAR